MSDSRDGGEGLPRSWSCARLGDLAEFIMGQAPPGEHCNKDGAGAIFVKAGEFGPMRPVVREWTTRPLRFAEHGDVLMCVVGATAGKLNLGIDCAIGRSVAAIRPQGGIPAEYLYFYLMPLVLELRHASAGSAQGVISKGDLEDIVVRIAPLPEQFRIIDAIETQLTRLDAAVAALERVRANLKRYRASVFKAAVEGRLVPTEAELARREGGDYEPASVLLQRILAERRRRWEKAELAAMTAKGKAPKDDKWKAKYREPVAPDMTGLPELPAGWCWGSVEQLSTLVTDGDHNPPKRVTVGVPHLTAKHVKSWRLSIKGCTYVSEEGFERTRSRYDPVAGDVIVTCVGTVGETAIVPAGIVFSADRNLAACRLVEPIPLAMTLQITLTSPAWRRRVATASGSTAQPHLYLAQLRTMPIPLMPEGEQYRIQAEVERRLSICDELAREADSNLVLVGRLRQSILKWAFEGRLVAQDPNDEPASVLLERIRAERGARGTAPGPRRRGRPARPRPAEEAEAC